ncbi:MAG: hypothetical protein M1837_004949 [Sclerophora amabilis]|nr:MAG: hypothetical protein M1837_004949 [Sclerophora amabilis]
MHKPSPSYTYAGGPPSKYPSSHGTSSAFSASANANEDWTKISDLAERRRIQNRIAQRNYRKKLKRRLEDLERRAGSSSVSPPQTHQELQRSNSQNSDDAYSHDSMSTVTEQDSTHRHLSTVPFSSDQYASILQQDRQQPMFAHQYTRQLSTSPPPTFVGSYPSQDHMPCYSYPQHTPRYKMVSVPESHYRPTIPTTLPGMVPHHSGSIKQESTYAEDDSMGPFSMNFAAMAGLDMSSTHGYQASHPQTPPLSDCFEHSITGSPSDSLLMYPRTPVSIPASPPQFSRR